MWFIKRKGMKFHLAKRKRIALLILSVFFVSLFSFLSSVSNPTNQAQAATATFQPATGSGGASVDGTTYADIAWPYYPPWSQIYGWLSGNGSNATDVGMPVAVYSGWLAYCQLYRTIQTFDTSALPDDCTITGATLGVYTYEKQNDMCGDSAFGLSLVSSNPINSNAIQNEDYDPARYGTTRFGTDIVYSAVPVGGWNTFTLNAAGLANISKTGVSKFGIRIPADVDNYPPGTGTWTWAIIRMYTADYGDHTTYAPTLTVTYDIPPPAQVTNLHHTGNTTSTISWDWDDTADATGYRVYRASDNAQLADVAVSNWDQGSLSPNVQSTVYVKAYNAGGEGTASANASAYTSANPPSGASHSGNTTTGITWTWNVNSNPAGTQFYASDSTGNSGWSADAVSWNASSGHTANTQYTVSAKARNGDNEETSAVTASAYTSIENPTGATWGTVGTDSIALSGQGTISNLSSGSSGIYFRESVTGTNSGWLTTNTWTRNSLSPNTQYHFYITTKNGDGEANTEQGPYDKYTLVGQVTGASALSGWDSNPAIGNYVIVSWNILSATSVRIRCLNTGTDVYTGAWSPYVHSLLPANTLYTYRIYSRNGEGIENPSYVQVSATTPPDQPQNLVLTGLTANTATVAWNQVTGATGYILSYGTDTNAENIGEIIITGLTNTTYTFQNLEPETTYYVKVRADNGSLGAWSNIITFQTQEAPPSPSELISTGIKAAIILVLFLIIFTSTIFVLNKVKKKV